MDSPEPDGKYKQWGLHHSPDIWHAAKNLGRKLRRAGEMKDQSELLPWIRDIVNHFWYFAKQASSVEEFKRLFQIGGVGAIRFMRNHPKAFLVEQTIDDKVAADVIRNLLFLHKDDDKN
ncbi:hypothetical protein F2P81_025564 [Scophthalmus maximus]|uniref:Uncharacterized protein n=1 Tax=Scophthalmus maximus TaxID=52904 RepID=A0A6A4RPM9_SCOMX|nr:hypothetical protein F2P81_025564 [Scophthalmus maximus]